jgi:hypothetical protein
MTFTRDDIEKLKVIVDRLVDEAPAVVTGTVADQVPEDVELTKDLRALMSAARRTYVW